MSDPIHFTAASPRFALPFLFAGQAQKEFVVNEAYGLIDALLHPAVVGEANAAPETPVDGECWLVGPDPAGDWTGRAGQLACRQAGTWMFIAPREGMRVLDRATGQDIRYDGGWQRPVTPSVPVDGETVDAQARAAIGQLIEAMIAAGLLPSASARSD